MPKKGRGIYQIYAAIVLGALLSDNLLAQPIVAIVGALLLVINSVGVFLLLKEISYNFAFTEQKMTPIGSLVELS